MKQTSKLVDFTRTGYRRRQQQFEKVDTITNTI